MKNLFFFLILLMTSCICIKPETSVVLKKTSLNIVCGLSTDQLFHVEPIPINKKHAGLIGLIGKVSINEDTVITNIDFSLVHEDTTNLQYFLKVDSITHDTMPGEYYDTKFNIYTKKVQNYSMTLDTCTTQRPYKCELNRYIHEGDTGDIQIIIRNENDIIINDDKYQGNDSIEKSGPKLCRLKYI